MLLANKTAVETAVARGAERLDHLDGLVRNAGTFSRHIQPIEVGRVIAFLLSEQTVIIRGQAINVDGGDTPC